MTRAAGPARVPFDAWYAAHRRPVDAVADAAADLRAELAGLAQDVVGMAGVLVPAVWLLPPAADAAAAGIAGYIVLSHLVRLGEAVGLLRRRRADLADFRAGATYAPDAATTPAGPDPNEPVPSRSVPSVPALPVPAGLGRSESRRSSL